MTGYPKKIFVLTGAGVSAESGLGTFRDRGGIWARFDPMKLATPEAYAADPDTVLDFYDHRRRGVIAAEPNAAHGALAQAEARLAARGGRLFLCTQNVDDLHERAGSRAVTHMHGELLKARCCACGTVTPWRADLTRAEACPACGAEGRMRRTWSGSARCRCTSTRSRRRWRRPICSWRWARRGRLPGGRLRAAGPGARNSDLRDQPRTLRQCRRVRRGAVRTGQRGAAGLSRGSGSVTVPKPATH